MGKKFRNYFISGLVIFLPLALTVNLFVLTFNISDGFLGKYIQPYFSREFGFYVRGLSILICVLLIFVIGFLGTNFLGRRLFPIAEGFLLKLPFFKQVYPALKEVFLFLFRRDKLAFQKVVLVQYPRKGIYSIGFLTNATPKKICEKTLQELYSVFVPHTPSPLGGFLILFPREDLIFPEISVEEAIKFVISAGVVKTD